VVFDFQVSRMLAEWLTVESGKDGQRHRRSRCGSSEGTLVFPGACPAQQSIKMHVSFYRYFADLVAMLNIEPIERVLDVH